MNRHGTPTIEAAVVIALVVASVLFVILEKPPGRDIAPGPHPELAGLEIAGQSCENSMPGAICEHNPVAQHHDEDFFADCTFADQWKPVEDEVVTVYVKNEQNRVTAR